MKHTIHTIIRGCCVLLTLSFLAFRAAPSDAVARADQNRPAALGQHLRQDGTIDTISARGSLDASGYTMRLGTNDEPHFAPAAADDEGWDDRFGAPGVYDGQVEATVVSANGDLYVAGAFYSNESSVEANHVARWDGRRWYALGDGVSGDLERVLGLATHGTDVYAVGSFAQAGGVVAHRVARWDSSAWHAVGTGVGPSVHEYGGTRNGDIYAVATAPNGDLYVAGNFTHMDDVLVNGVARWDGAAWHALGAGLADRGIVGGTQLFPAWVYALAVGPDGSLYAGGQFSDAGDVSARNVARWDGTAWHALGAGGGDVIEGNQIRALAVDGSNVYVGGSFTNAGGAPANNIAMWNSQAWKTLGAGPTSELNSPAPVLSLLAQKGALYAGGTFTSAGGKAITRLARWDGAHWSAVGAPITIVGSRVMVRTLAASQQGGLFAGGSFEQAGGVDVYGITHWNGERWENLGQGVALVGDMSAQVNAVAIDDAGRVYVGGFINTVGGLHVNNVAMWDGTRWYDMGGGVTAGPDGTVYALLAIDNDVYVGGQFTQAGGASISHIARWNSTAGQWSALGGGIDDTVCALALGDGVLYAGGSFKQAGDARVEDVAVWDGANWQALGGAFEIFEILDSGNEAGTFVRALSYHNGDLFIGGHFQTVHEKQASTQGGYVAVHNVVGYTPATQDMVHDWRR